VNECLDTGWVSSSGRFVGAFERAFADYCGAPEAVSCNNGTTALHLALLALGLEPGDEVIVPTLTYVASANAVRYCGATPVLVDAEPRTMNLDPGRVEELITPRTRAILAVHLFGHPADMDALDEIARRRGVMLVEDAAEAHGATYKGRRVGALTAVATFSFFGNKIITTGEGGMITLQDPALAARMRLLRGQGIDPARRYWFPVIGYNYRMTNIAAAIGLAQLEGIEGHLEARQRVRRWYDERLADLVDWLEVPVEEPWARHSFWMYTILLRHDIGIRRDELMRCLEADGIETRPVFYPMHVQPPHLDPSGRFPVADDLSARGMNLPTHGRLTEDDVDFVVARIRAHLGISVSSGRSA
jgi:perosamine synthetase